MRSRCDCKCGDCRIRFQITFGKSVPPFTIVCPVCQSKLIDTEWKHANKN